MVYFVIIIVIFYFFYFKPKLRVFQSLYYGMYYSVGRELHIKLITNLKKKL